MAQLDNGSACGQDSACKSGHCADGVCCDTACTGQCQRCDLPSTLGTCSIISGAPVGGRPACTTDGSACGGTCDGTNPSACTYPSNTVNCASATCAAGQQFPAVQCDGSGSCGKPQGQSCGNYACGTMTCKNVCASDSDCATGNYCRNNACVNMTDLGTQCTGDDQCTSGHCADGVCCDKACQGQCESCAESGKAGTCTAVMGVPRNGRMACKGMGTCAGAC